MSMGLEFRVEGFSNEFRVESLGKGMFREFRLGGWLGVWVGRMC